jgi:hypothetical protein
MRMIRQAVAAAVLSLAGGAALAGDTASESHVLNGAKVTLFVYPFLDQTELATLRLVMTNAQALALFLPDTAKGFAAIAVAPDEGFIRNGKPVASAVALGGLPDAETAQTQALAGCDAKRAASGKPCVIVLEVGPKG